MKRNMVNGTCKSHKKHNYENEKFKLKIKFKGKVN